MGKKVLAANGIPSTPCSSGHAPLASTPSNPNACPSPLSPLLQAGTPNHTSSLIVALNQLKAAVAASPINAANKSPLSTSHTVSHVDLSSPQAVTALVSEALKGAKTGTQLASSLQMAASPSTTARQQLHNQCPTQQNAVSPLLKSMGAASPISRVAAVNGSPHAGKSPGPKIVTVSKLPSTITTQNDQLSTLLQTIQQHSSTNVYLSKPVHNTNGIIILDGNQASASSEVV